MHVPDERHARAWLTTLARPADPKVAQMIATLGAIETAAALARTAPDHSTYDPQRSNVVDRRSGDLRNAFVIPGDPEWPPGLDDLGEARPYGLWIRGGADPAGVLNSAIAIVGARTATPYGNSVAAEFAAGLSERSYTIISGGAYGIDAAAHRAALATDGPTVAVLAGGLDRPYPHAHVALFDQIARDGLLVSEAPPGQTPCRTAFLARNRIIVALAQAVVVVQAIPRSGTMSAAAAARELGRPLFAVPGPITSMLSAGPHALLATGAGIAVDTDSILRHLPAPVPFRSRRSLS